MTAPSDPTGGMEPIRRANMPASLRRMPVMHEDAGTDCATWKDRAEAALREAGE